jgi:hypothetical protein
LGFIFERQKKLGAVVGLRFVALVEELDQRASRRPNKIAGYMPAFARHIGIDYSGAQTPTASLKGLRVYLAEGDAPPAEIPRPPSPKKYWTRRGIAEWLVEWPRRRKLRASSMPKAARKCL